jgi:D-sedoheptulose 7-phosphate isomerase
MLSLKNNIQEEIHKIFDESSNIIKISSTLSKEIEISVEQILRSLSHGKKIVIMGNGGSAADAQHIAAEFIGRFKMERTSIPAISLTTDTSILTSLGNDYSFDDIFKRQIEGLVNPGDVVIGISTSGNSINVKNALQLARKKNAKTIGLLGKKGGIIKKYADISIIVDSSSTPRIQEVHRLIYHIICELVEKKISEKNGKKFFKK